LNLLDFARYVRSHDSVLLGCNRVQIAQLVATCDEYKASSFDITQVDRLLSDLDKAFAQLQAEQHESERKRIDEKNQRIAEEKEKIHKRLKEGYHFRARNGFTTEIDSTPKFRDLRSQVRTEMIGFSPQTIEKFNRGEDCLNRNTEVSLKGALDQFETELAREVVEDRLKLTDIELFKRAQKIDLLNIVCSERDKMSGARCLGVLSGSCFIEPLVLTER